MQVRIYTPESRVRHPREFLRDMFSDLLASRELAWRLFVRDTSAKYRQTFLGYAWALLPAVATTLVWTLLNSSKILQVGETDIPYPAFVMIGTLLWQVFVDSMHMPLGKISAAKSMLAKVDFPREAIVLAGLGEVLLNFVIRGALVIVVFLWFGLPIGITVLLVPVGIAALMSFGAMIGTLLTPLGLLYQDVGQCMRIGAQFWFFLTPIVYPPPTEYPASLLADLNPVSPLVTTTRAWLTGQPTTALLPFAAVGAGSILLLFAGWTLCRLAVPHLIERMSA